MSKTGEARRQSSKSRKEKVSTLVLLMREGLQEYYTYFEQAGFSMFDGGVHPSDLQVEQYIADTEKLCGVQFVPEVRIRLWKALRYQWFRGPGHVQPFIEKSQVPQLFLPKLDYKQIDSMVRIPEICPDRQRQFIRTAKPSGQASFRGPAVINLQFEVFKRQDEVVYELQDVERCVNEWQNRNPRTMLPEDPREEIMRLRIRSVQEQSGLALLSRRVVCAMQKRVEMFLWVLRMVMLGMAGLMFGAGYYRYRNSPEEIIMGVVVGSNQFVSGTSFFLAYMFAYVVGLRWHHDAKSVKLQRLQYQCQRLTESISDFRVETEGQRMPAEETVDTTWVMRPRLAKQPKQKKEKRRNRHLDLAGGAVEGEARQRVKKPKREKDESIAMWAGANYHKKDPQEQMMLIKKNMEESYKRLEEIAMPGYKPLGGQRMATFASRVRMPQDHEDKLCIRPAPRPVPPAPLRALQGSMPPRAPIGLALGMPPAPMLPSPPPAGLPAPPPSRPVPGGVSPAAASRSRGRSRSQQQEMAVVTPAAAASHHGFGEPADDLDPDEASRLYPWLPGHMPASSPEDQGGPE